MVSRAVVANTTDDVRPIADSFLRVEEEGAARLALETGPVGAVVEESTIVRVGKVRVVNGATIDDLAVFAHQTLA